MSRTHVALIRGINVGSTIQTWAFSGVVSSNAASKAALPVRCQPAATRTKANGQPHSAQVSTHRT